MLPVGPGQPLVLHAVLQSLVPRLRVWSLRLSMPVRSLWCYAGLLPSSVVRHLRRRSGGDVRVLRRRSRNAVRYLCDIDLRDLRDLRPLRQ